MEEKAAGKGLKWTSGFPGILFLCSLIIVIGAFLINQVWDLDVWWHVAIGNDILNHLSIPTLDRYTLAGLGRPYHDSHWLFQVLLASVHRLGGMVGVEMVMVAFWTFALLFCWQAMRRSAPPALCHILLFLVAMASMERFLPRPEIVNYLLMTLFYLRLRDGKYKTAPELLLFGVLQILWTNSYGLFVLGPFMAGCYWLVAAVRFVRRRASDFPALSRLMGVLLVATVLPPAGFSGWRYALLLLTEVSPSASKVLKSVGELSPTFGKAAMSAPAFWFYAVLLSLTILTSLLALIQQKISVERLLIVAALALVALTGRRNMVLFALVGAPLLAENLSVLVPNALRNLRTVALPAALAMLLWSWYPLSGRYYLMMEIPTRFGWGATPSFYPYGLPSFLKRTGFRGAVFNSNTLGGFYLQSLGRPPLTDGRLEIYDPRLLDAILLSPITPPVWRQVVAGYDIRGVLLQHASPEAASLLRILPADPQWRLVYYDYAASFWMRSDTPALPPAIDLYAGQTLPPGPSRVDDCLILDNFLHSTGADALHLQNLERILSFNVKKEQTLERIGDTQTALKKLAEAEQTFLELHKDYPNNSTGLNMLAYFAYSRGDLKTAEMHLLRALQVNPEDEHAKTNYARIKAALGN